MRGFVATGWLVLALAGASGCASGALGDGPINAVGEIPDAGPATVDAAPSVPDAGPTALVLTQTLSDAIVPQNSAACITSDANGVPIETLENSYYRVFDLTALGVTGDVTLDSVTLGVELATSPTGSQTITVRLHTLVGALQVANLTQLTSLDVAVPDQSGTLLDVPMGAVVPAGSVLVVEVLVPDATGTGNLFFIGSNASGQTGPSYLRAPTGGCGIAEPTDLAALGFGSMHMVLRAAGEH